MEEKIKKYFFEKYPEEACGILLNKKGVLTWCPCENVALDKLNNFKISGKDFIS